MPQSICPQCRGPISFGEANFAPYLCSKCKADNKCASQAATLDACGNLRIAFSVSSWHRYPRDGGLRWSVSCQTHG